MTRALTFSLCGFLLITFLGPVQRFLGLEMAGVDVPLLSVLYLTLGHRGLGLSRGPYRSNLFSGGIDWSGAVTGFVLGYTVDLLGGGVKGLHCLTTVLLFLFCLWAVRHVYLAGKLSVIVVTFVASLLGSLIVVTVRWLAGVSPSLATLTIVISQAALCAAVSPVFMRLFLFIDERLFLDSSTRGSLCQ
jgi:hypothetical protein